MFSMCDNTERMQTPPHIVLDPRNAEVAAGDSVEFSCNSTGYPPPNIIWLRNGVEVNMTEDFLSPNKTITVTTVHLNTYPELVVSILSIQQVDLTDAGNYSCLATNNLTETLFDTSVGALLSVQCKF